MQTPELRVVRAATLLAAHITQQPKDQQEYDDCGYYPAAELPRDEPGKASTSRTFHKRISSLFLLIRGLPSRKDRLLAGRFRF